MGSNSNGILPRCRFSCGKSDLRRDLVGSVGAERHDCGGVLPLAQTAVYFPDARSSDALYFRGLIPFKVVSY